jgi:DNA modification methylase
VVARSDARQLPLGPECIDAIVTSPPYASAVDYVRAHKFALNWMGYEIGDLGRLRREFLGAEIIGDTDASLEGSARETVDRIAEVDSRRSRHIGRYFQDLARVLRECYRVLRPGRAAVWVVGPSTVRGVLVDTPKVLVDLGCAAGFRLGGVKERKIDRDRRLLPQGRHTQGEGIEARVHREAVIGFLKD